MKLPLDPKFRNSDREILDNTGKKHTLRHCASIGVGPVELMAFFYRQLSELLYAGHGSAWIGYNNKCRAIYMECDGRIVGFIVYDFLVDQKRVWINFVSVDPEYRKRGLFSAMFSELESVSKQLGAIEISSYVHVDNTVKLESASKQGMHPWFHRMSKPIR